MSDAAPIAPAPAPDVPPNDSLLGVFRRSSWFIKLRLVFCLLAAIVIVLSDTYVIRGILHLQVPAAPKPDEAWLAAQKKIETVPDFAFPYELKNLAIPLGNKLRNRITYTQFTLVLDCPSEDARRLMTLSRAKLLDAIYETAQRMPVEKFANGAGFTEFKQRILAKYSARFKHFAPRTIAIRDWVLQ